MRSMTTLTITAKGQVTLNKALLRHLGLKPGDKLEVAEQPGRKLSFAPTEPPRIGHLSDIYGMLKRPGQKSLTVEEINEAIGQSVAEDDERIVSEARARRS